MELKNIQFVLDTWRREWAGMREARVLLHHSLNPRGMDPRLAIAGSGGYIRPGFDFPRARKP